MIATTINKTYVFRHSITTTNNNDNRKWIIYTSLYLNAKYVLRNASVLNKVLDSILFENSNMYYESKDTSTKIICCGCRCGNNAKK